MRPRFPFAEPRTASETRTGFSAVRSDIGDASPDLLHQFYYYYDYYHYFEDTNGYSRRDSRWLLLLHGDDQTEI